jgi:hypothetical protein
MISAGDFRNGVTFEEDGNVLQVIEFQHVKPGKGAAFVRTKTKNVSELQQGVAVGSTTSADFRHQYAFGLTHTSSRKPLQPALMFGLITKKLPTQVPK